METTQQHRIGLVLASIHTGSANALWSDVARFSEQEGDSLFVFPGGRLAYQQEHEYLRNSIYALVHAGNLDGVIAWGSSLGGVASIEDVQHQYQHFGSLACVTLGLKREGYPNIAFDAYTGVLQILQHCSTIHNTQRIACIRGPENHLSSMDRYRGYVEALNLLGMDYDARLVSDPFSWNEGDKALEQLVLGRGLIPGKDFDLLLCCSDMMMFAAGKRLEQLGYRIPQDIKVVGFNNSYESHLLQVPCTTVKMPVAQMAFMSWSIVRQLVEKKGSLHPDLVLPCELVIRNSCGCQYSLGGVEQAEALFTDDQGFLTYLSDKFSLTHVSLREVSALFQESRSGKLEESYLERVTSLVYSFLDKGGDPSLLSEALHWYSLFYADEYFNKNLAGPISALFLRQLSFITHEHAYALSQQKEHLNSFKSDLLGVQTLVAHARVLLDHLPQVGFDGCFMIVYEGEQCNRFVGGFLEDQIFETEELFHKTALLPPNIDALVCSGVYVVEPLFIENQPLGYVVIKTRVYDGSLLEEVRSALSSSLKASFLFEESKSAQERAERAHHARIEFLAHVGEGLRTPLENIQAEVEILEETEFASLKNSVLKDISQATHLLELSFSESGVIELDQRILSVTTLIEEIVWQQGLSYEGPEALPVVIADRLRLAQVFTILSTFLQQEGAQVQLSATIQEEGLVCTFQSSSHNGQRETREQDSSVRLAQSLIMLHGGEFWFYEDSISLRLPWPTLSQEKPLLAPSSPFIYVSDEVGEALPTPFASLHHVQVRTASHLLQHKQELAHVAGILWDDSDRSPAKVLLLHQLFHDEHARALFFVCLDCPEGASSIQGALSFASEGICLVSYGQIPDEIASLLTPTKVLQLPHEKEFFTFIDQQDVALFITDTFSLSLFQEIRRRKVTSSVPIVLVKEEYTFEEVEKLSLIPNLLMVHPSVVGSSEFLSRLIALAGGEELLPPLTSALVKRALVYMAEHATEQFSRWQLAEAVHVSEDYLTRIFRREVGLSPWDYLNRYRIYLATAELRQTSMTIQEIALSTGFQDQAYFCRVFKKIMGFSPGKIRTGE